MTDIIDAIEAAIGCQYCGKALRGDGPSPDFCDEPCQMAWRARLVRALPQSDRAALLHDRPGRGFSADLVIFDEAFSLIGQIASDAREIGEAIGAQMPTPAEHEQLEAIEQFRQADSSSGWLARWFRRHR